MIRFPGRTAVRDRPVFILGSGRCGSTLLQSILNSNPKFLIWGEHNGFLRPVAEAYYGAAHQHFPVEEALNIRGRKQRLRHPEHWNAWDNLCGPDEFRDRFRSFVRSLFADPSGKSPRWGFKEIRYGMEASDQSPRLLAECFPEARFVILTRDPWETVFSMIAHWVLTPPAEALSAAQLDEEILSRSTSWNGQYLQLSLFAEAHARQCTSIRYEELDRPATYEGLAEFLEASRFDYRTHLERVHGAANKAGDAVARLRERMELLRPRVEEITRPAALRYGYAGRTAGAR